MARSPRSAATAGTAPSTPYHTPTPSASSLAPSTSTPSSAAGPARYTRRHQPLAPPAFASSSTASHPLPSTLHPHLASTPVATPPVLEPIAPVASSSSSHLRGPPPSRQPVEAKAHALRSVQGAGERVACPYPGQYGGKENCGLLDEDEADDVLMAICAACASMNNRALSPEELAAVAIQYGWLRPPSAAIEPSSIITAAIRTHVKRCEKGSPARPPLLAKHQLAGSAAEAVLEPALLPGVCNGAIRPKGPVYYLAPAGKVKWRSPFEGLDVPKPPAKKPGPPKKVKKEKDSAHKKGSAGKAKMPAPAGPLKIRLVLNAAAVQEEEDLSDVGSSSMGSRSRSRSRSTAASTVAAGSVAEPRAEPSKRVPRRMRDALDSSSDESDSSDSDMAVDGPARAVKPVKSRKPPPPPIAITNSPRLSHLGRTAQNSPFRDLFFPSPIASALHAFAPPTSSPFPTHSLDNTTWAARTEQDRFAAFETSSSSSDDEIRDPEWGNNSGILIRGGEGEVELGAEGDELLVPVWAGEDEEAKVKEATEALRVLFPMTSPDEEVDLLPSVQLNQLDNRPAPSDTSSLADSTSTSTATATAHPFAGHVKMRDPSISVPIGTWDSQSSPIPSPSLRAFANLAPDSSPTQHLSKLRSSLDPEEMEVDDDRWLDESGELPVRAEDSFSDIDLTSTIGDVPTPEHDRRLHTAEWARAAAANTEFRVKEEPEDYPSPLITEPDDQVVPPYHPHSRAGSAESHTPSSGSSDLPPFEMDPENAMRMCLDEIVVGPESVTVDEIDGWMPPMKPEKTPSRVRNGKSRHHPTRCSGSWGSIGVGAALSAIPAKLSNSVKSPVMRTRSHRIAPRRRRSSSCATTQIVKHERAADPASLIAASMVDEPEVFEMDAIGPADLEAARAEADEREEQQRRACREKAEQQKAFLEAYRKRMNEADGTERLDPSTPSLWSDLTGPPLGPWNSNDTILSTPGTGALSPMVLHSVSALSLGDLPSSVDPKALLSPPIQPFATSGSFDEIMSPEDMKAIMGSTSGLGIGVSESGQGGLARSAPLPSTAANVPFLAPPVHTAKKSVSPATNTSNLPSTGPPVNHVTSETAPILITPAAAPAPNLAPIPKPALSGNAIPDPVDAGKISPSPSTSSAPSTTSSTSATSTSATTNVSERKGHAMATPLCHGVNACVLDNIPVYSYVYEGKGGKATLLRRLDTDFVNGNALLLALGIPLAKHREHLSIPSQYLAAHHHVPAVGGNGISFAAGVPGLWIPFPEAKELAKRCRLPEKAELAHILRDDLFHLFAVVAKISSEHAISETFGGPFIAGMTKSQGKSVPSTGSGNTGNGTLTASSANSRSTPNLSALGGNAAPASAPAGLRGPTPIVKGSLVRAAPVAQPDGCPQPKRRRATIVGESPLKITPIATAQPAGGVAPGSGVVNGAGMGIPVSASAGPMKKAGLGSAPAFTNATPGQGGKAATARRATRASLGGETPKPKVSK